MVKIKIQRISDQNFCQYGQVVSFPESAPTAQSLEFKFWSDLAHYYIDGESEIGICTVYYQPKSVVSCLERHVETPEILIPIEAPFLLPLLLNKEESEKVAVFQVNLGEAVIVNQGVWHGACLPVGRQESSYFVIFKRGTPHTDVEKKPVQPIEIVE